MTLRALVAAALVSIALSSPAQAGIYHYTGNSYTWDTIHSGGNHVEATLDIDVADNFSGLLWNPFDDAVTGWSMSSGSIVLNAANVTELTYRIEFLNGTITGWFLNAENDSHTIQSLSTNYAFFAPNEGHEIVIVKDPLATSAVFNNDGAWVSAVEVPEPGAFLLFGAALAGMVGARRRTPR